MFSWRYRTESLSALRANYLTARFIAGCEFPDHRPGPIWRVGDIPALLLSTKARRAEGPFPPPGRTVNQDSSRIKRQCQAELRTAMLGRGGHRRHCASMARVGSIFLRIVRESKREGLNLERTEHSMLSCLSSISHLIL
jgi:hypothetical protein